ncbi:MAG: hypothetical protein H7281_13280 [Bacteriovorax sp.]|nr:hypothetical protein [Bacteriovorax sp.]
MKNYLLIILILFPVLVACSKKAEKVELKYSVEEIDNLAHETGHSNEKNGGGLNLSDYSPGVNRLESKALMFKRLTFFAVSFETVEQARTEALRLNQYYARNWLFDRVEGEPILEDYLMEKFKAINPKRHIQRVPKKHEEGHGKSHESAPSEHH